MLVHLVEKNSPISEKMNRFFYIFLNVQRICPVAGLECMTNRSLVKHLTLSRHTSILHVNFLCHPFTLVLDHSLACHEVVCVSVYRNIHVNFSTFLDVWKHVNVLGYFQCVGHCLKVDDV